VTCGSSLPVVTVADRSRPCGPGAPRTQHGQGVRSRLVADASGAPVLRDHGPDRPAGHGKADVAPPEADRPGAGKGRVWSTSPGGSGRTFGLVMNGVMLAVVLCGEGVLRLALLIATECTNSLSVVAPMAAVEAG
jgi:hypothetical protein